MSRPLVFIVGRFHNNCLLQAEKHKDIEFRQVDQWSPEIPDIIKADGLIIRSKTQVDEKLLAAMPDLKVIVTATAGFDHINFFLTNDAKIKVAHAPEAPVSSVVELFLMLTIGACRKQRVMQTQLAEGNWDRSPLTGRQLRGQMLGIVGCGRIGRAVAHAAHELGMRIAAYDPYIEDIPPHVEMMGFDELLRSSDVLSLHVPSTPKTRHMINESTLSSLATNAIIVNTSRGSAINESQLIRFLQENPEAHAALDVFENEPLALDSPLYKLPNVILSPHIGAATDECLSQSSFQAMRSIESFFAGEPMAHPLPPQTRWWDEAQRES